MNVYINDSVNYCYLYSLSLQSLEIHSVAFWSKISKDSKMRL